jgi:hypothetical protein
MALFETTSGNREIILKSSAATGNNTIAGIRWQALDSTNVNTTFAGISAVVTDNTNGSEDGAIVFQTTLGGSLQEKLRIISAGNVGIGTTTPTSGKLVVKVSGGVYGTTVEDASGNIRLGQYLSSASGNPGQFYIYDGSNNTHIYLNSGGGSYINGVLAIGKTSQVDSSRVQIEGAKAHSAGIPQQQLNISDSTAVATGVGGAIGFSGKFNGSSQTTFGSIEGYKDNATSGNYDGSLVFKTRAHAGANNERLRILSGGGITFNGDTSANNALDDYEEGTFTPYYWQDGGQHSLGYGEQYGYYTKVGNIVTCNIWIRTTSGSTGGGGNLYINGWPFTSANNTGGRASGSIGYVGNWNTYPGYYYHNPGNTVGRFFGKNWSTGNLVTSFNYTALANGSDHNQIAMTLVYEV